MYQIYCFKIISILYNTTTFSVSKCQKTPEQAGPPLVTRSLHRWDQVHTEHRWQAARVCRPLDDKRIDAIDWSSRSPDLNQIENLWDVLYRCVRRRQELPQTVQELTDALIQVREEIPQDTLCRLIRSMPRRQACIQARRGHTHYWVTLWVRT